MSYVFNLNREGNSESREYISRSLDEYNIEHASMDDNVPLDVYVRDEHTGDLLGGIVGRTSLGVLFISYFYLHPSARKKGIGKHILGLAEQEAIRRGCEASLLFTMQIQAPDFYKLNGYEVFGEIPCRPAGNARIFMMKRLGAN